MRFKCGRSNSDIERREDWHHWFAWHPVTIDEVEVQCVWLETVERKGKWIGGYDPMWTFTYREIQND